MPALKRLLEEMFDGVEVLSPDAFPVGTELIGRDSTIEAVKAAGVDAVVVGNAACGACSAACAVAASKLELSGIPTVTVVREEFADVVSNTASGLGLPPDLPMVTFPIDIFLPNSDLSPLEGRAREIFDKLLSWSPRLPNAEEQAMITVEGRDFRDAMFQANKLFLQNGWGDGLPLWPAEPDLVDRILRGTDLPRDHLLGRLPPRGGAATIEACAIALTMTGGRPEYLPVLLAAVEAMLDPAANSELMQSTSAATVPVVVVNGPIAKQIRLGGGFGCLGPDPKHPAGAVIGRALRQLQQNLGGAVPGSGTMSTWGPMRQTNIVFAEDEDGLPKDWVPHATHRHGFAPGTNSVSMFWATGATNIKRRGAMKEALDVDMLEGMHRIAGFLSAPHLHYTTSYETGVPGLLLLPRIVAAKLAETGWTQHDLRQFLWEHARISHEMLRKSGGFAWIDIAVSEAARRNALLDPWPITADPDNFAIAIAGGEHPTHALWLQAFSPNVVGRRITVTARMDELLVEADMDLGFSTEVCKL